jgi:predicted PurR-regulated permease PerM
MLFPGDLAMEKGMIELLDKISQSTSYIAIGGTVALLFLLIFAQSIFGSRTTQSQLKNLIGQTERMNEKLEQIARSLKKQQEQGKEEQQASE